MLDHNCNAEAALYYLYMMADGEVSCGEEKLFQEICKELNIGTDERNAVIEKCRGFASGKSDVFSVMIREKIDEQAGQGWFGLRDESSFARIIWNLVDLGYADSFYSDEEKKIVNYLVDKWEVKEEIYQEFVDTADTILTLTEQKEWVVSTYSRGSLRDKKLKDIDSELEQLSADIRLTIEELTM